MQLTQGLHSHARRRSGRIALVCGDVALSWAQLRDRVAGLAGAMVSAGLQADGRVAILAPNGAMVVEATYAALWAGGVAVPVNARFALPEMIGQVTDAEPAILVADASFAAEAAAIRAACPSLKAVLHHGPDAPPGTFAYDAALRAAPPAADAGRGGNDLACLFYTGGTTGRAKGVMLSHANLWANAAVTAAACGFTEELVHLHAGPLFHLGAAARVFTTTVVGGTHVVLPRFSAEAVLDAIGRHRVTTATFVPTMLAMILDRPDLDRFDLSSLRLITYGASPMPAPVLRRSLQRFPAVRFAQSYGMTELSPVATMLTEADHAPGAPAHRLRSAGRPVFSADLRVLDPEGRDVPTGTVGEIAVKGPMVMLGYWRQPELTRRVLRDGWMHTGDAGYLDADGYLYVTDRLKDMIISGGENVYSLEVENALASHPAVAACAVVGLPDERWGERVHAAVVLAEPGTAEALVAHCRTLIAGYKCPRSVAFLDALPLSSVGKVDKAALRAAAAATARAA